VLGRVFLINIYIRRKDDGFVVSSKSVDYSVLPGISPRADGSGNLSDMAEDNKKTLIIIGG